MAGGLNPIANLLGRTNAAGDLIVAVEGGVGPAPDGVTITTNAGGTASTVNGVQSARITPTLAEVLAGVTVVAAVAGHAFRVIGARAVAVGGDSVNGTLSLRKVAGGSPSQVASAAGTLLPENQLVSLTQIAGAISVGDVNTALTVLGTMTLSEATSYVITVEYVMVPV